MANNTYVALSTQTVGTAVSSVTFSPISSAYTDLVLVMQLNTSSLVDGSLRFNGDTGNNYSVTRLYGGSGGAFSDRFSNISSILIGDLSTNTDSATILQIQNYSNTNVNKTVLVRANPNGRPVFANVGLWRNTAAITSITLTSSANFAVGSTFTLYGIAAASVGAKATGGIISQDETYYYHTFLGNGTFTPTQTLTADVLVVGAGGGGGSQRGCRGNGGGGAGGYRTISAGSYISGTGYTVTIGAGGAGGTTTGASGNNTVFSSTTAAGGGGGGAGTNDGVAGGSGGGGVNGGAGGAGNTPSVSPSQGNNGGVGSLCAGGGGGAGAVGGAGTSTVGGNGGIGVLSSISGTATYYAGGGGGGAGNGNSGSGCTPGTGGLGGGGNAGPTSGSGNGSNGTVNTGGGGGGGSEYSGCTSGNGGTGGSGIVIVRYTKA